MSSITWAQSKTPYRVGEERAARKPLVAVEDKIAAGEEVGIDHEGPLTVDDFAKKGIKDRRLVGVTDWENDERRLKPHCSRTSARCRSTRCGPGTW